MRMNGQKLQECRMVHNFYRGHQLFPTTNEPQHVYCEMQLKMAPLDSRLDWPNHSEIIPSRNKNDTSKELIPKNWSPCLKLNLYVCVASGSRFTLTKERKEKKLMTESCTSRKSLEWELGLELGEWVMRGSKKWSDKAYKTIFFKKIIIK